MQETDLESQKQSFHSTISWNSIYWNYTFNNVRDNVEILNIEFILCSFLDSRQTTENSHKGIQSL